VLLSGMGGIGKSTTCAQWFHRYATDHFEHLAWISCKDGIANGLAESRIYQHLSIDDNPEALINTVAHFKGKTLFVLDDIRDPNDALLKQFKNIGHSDFNLITTSRQKLPGFKQQTIGVLSPEHCLALFRQFYQTSQTELLEQLIEKAGRHTLTIELIAKTMAENDISPQEMLIALEKQGFDLSKTLPEAADYEKDGEEYTEQLNQALNKLFDISELGEEHKFALFLLGHFNGAQFVKRRVKEWFNLSGLKPLNELEKLGWISKADEQAISGENASGENTNTDTNLQVGNRKNHQAELPKMEKPEVEKAKIEKPNLYFLHPVISDLARRIFDKELQQNQEFSSGDKVNNALGSRINSKLENRLEIKLGEAQLEEFLHNIIESLDDDKFDDRYPGDFHILQPLYQFYGYLKTPTEVLASAMHDTAFQLSKQANYQQSFELYELVLAIREKVLGPEHSDVATTLNNLAELYRAKGDYDAALPRYECALVIVKKVFGPEHPHVAATLNNLAGLYQNKGDYDAALPRYERALAIVEKVLGPEHPYVASTLNNLAGLYGAKGEYDKALPLNERSLGIREKVLGPEHPDVAVALNNLAEFYKSKGEYEAALPLHERSLDIREKALGSEHPDVATTLNNLAGLYESKGNYDAALPLYERALAIREKALGPEHPDVAMTLNDLALLYKSKGDYNAALPLYKRALEISEKALGPEHPDVATTLNNLAGLYESKRDYGEALPLFVRSLNILNKKLGNQHPHTQQGAINFLRCFVAFQESIQGEEVQKNGLHVDEDELKRAIELAVAILVQGEELK